MDKVVDSVSRNFTSKLLHETPGPASAKSAHRGGSFNSVIPSRRERHFCERADVAVATNLQLKDNGHTVFLAESITSVNFGTVTVASTSNS